MIQSDVGSSEEEIIIEKPNCPHADKVLSYSEWKTDNKYEEITVEYEEIGKYNISREEIEILLEEDE